MSRPRPAQGAQPTQQYVEKLQMARDKVASTRRIQAARNCQLCGSKALRDSVFCKWHQPDYVRAKDRPPGAAPGPHWPPLGAEGAAAPGPQDVVAGPSAAPAGPGQGPFWPAPLGYDVRGTLRAIALDRKANATARTAAARTLAELDGLLGKHQAAPDRTNDRLLSSLSRVELARELARLRAQCAGDSAR